MEHLRDQPAELAAGKLVLRLADSNDYLVAGLRPAAVPDSLPAGRGFALPDADSVQVAALTGQAQGAAENGVVGDATGQLRVTGPGYLVIGAPGRGRSTALTAAARALAADGEPLILLIPARSPLAHPAGQPAAWLHLAGTDADAALTAALGQPGPTSVIADDANLLTGTPLGEALAAWYATVARSGAGGGRLLAAVRPQSVAAPRGLLQKLADCKCGLVLTPAAPADGLPLGLRLPTPCSQGTGCAAPWSATGKPPLSKYHTWRRSRRSPDNPAAS